MGINYEPIKNRIIFPKKVLCSKIHIVTKKVTLAV